MSRRGSNVRVSCAINVLSWLLVTAAICSRVYFKLHPTGGSPCTDLHPRIPHLDLAFFLLWILMLKYIIHRYSFAPNTNLSYMFSSFMILNIIAIFGFSGFALVVTHGGAGRVIPGRSYREYNESDFSYWFRYHTSRHSDLTSIHMCLTRFEVCKTYDLKYNHLNATEFYKTNLSPIESGCCKPPSYCNYRYEKPSLWRRTGPEIVPAQRDCRHGLYYGGFVGGGCWFCNSCRGAILAGIRTEWRQVAITNFLIFIFLTIVLLPAPALEIFTQLH